MRIRPPECGEAYAHEECGTETIRLANLPARHARPSSKPAKSSMPASSSWSATVCAAPTTRSSSTRSKLSTPCSNAICPRAPAGSATTTTATASAPTAGPFTAGDRAAPGRCSPANAPTTSSPPATTSTPSSAPTSAFATCRPDAARAGLGRTEPPGLSLQLGQPDGSAVPLVWAHAEYLKLLRSAADGKVFDRIDPSMSATAPGRPRAICVAISKSTAATAPSRQSPPAALCASSTNRKFEVVWTTDDWKTYPDHAQPQPG